MFALPLVRQLSNVNDCSDYGFNYPLIFTILSTSERA